MPDYNQMSDARIQELVEIRTENVRSTKAQFNRVFDELRDIHDSLRLQEEDLDLVKQEKAKRARK